VLLAEREDLHDVVEAFRKLTAQKIIDKTAPKQMATATDFDPAEHNFRKYGLKKVDG
jgi:hypothetical protein